SGIDTGCPADAKRSSVCRSAAGACDVAESCDGGHDACPADVFRPSSTVCRASRDESCDPAELCTGTSAACPADVVSCADVCGNGIAEAGEDCDDGVANGTPGSCCTADCRLRAAGESCRE